MTYALHSHTHTTEGFGAFFSEVLPDSLIDALKVIPFLFLTYLMMEFIEHKASGSTVNVLKKAGGLGPVIGATFGILPQCAFSAVASNLYTGRIITLGTLISVFLSTSDEMLPMMLSDGITASVIFPILGYKLFVGLLVGVAIDLTMRLMKRRTPEINIDEICENDNCHCERGIFYSALHHTVKITVFILAVTLIINSLMLFADAEKIAEAVRGFPVLSHFISALVGLIPGCAGSVAITSLGLHGMISIGTMLSGLFSGSGVGILILLKQNKHPKENLTVIFILIISAVLFGALADLIGFDSLLATL